MHVYCVSFMHHYFCGSGYGYLFSFLSFLSQLVVNPGKTLSISALAYVFMGVPAKFKSLVVMVELVPEAPGVSYYPLWLSGTIHCLIWVSR